MKIFWALLIALVLGAVAYIGLKPAKKSADLVNAPPPPAPEVMPPKSVGKPTDEGSFFEGDKAAAPAPPPAPSAEVTKPADAPAASNSASSNQNTAPATETSTPGSTPLNQNQGLTKEQVAAVTGKAPKATDTTPAAEPVPPTAPMAPGAEATPAAPTTTVITDAPADVKIAKQDDGSVLVDEKFTLRGEGTAAHPYEITWDYLTSAEETYQPRLGKKTVPARLTMLNDKYVKISGYVAFPIMATEPTEMLSMLNQWDGCCIGVPPTPYDAIEVKLKKPAEGEERLASYGAIKGKFKVDPYLVKDWLVSLYMMDEGEVTRE